LLLPGTAGSFYLDDWPNLYGLNQVKNLAGFSSFVLDGVASQLGRPISLITFALQSAAWPNNPSAFKAVNLGIHLLNTILVFTLAYQLLKRLEFARRTVLFSALVIAFFWAVSPIQASTVFYTVQRMAMLSATFSLLGILAFLQLRQCCFEKQGSPWSAIAWTLLYCLSLALAVLSKENGILMPLLILVMTGTLLPWPANATKRWQRIWPYVFLAGPLLAVLVYLIVTRDWQWDRLLTQTRILWDYAFKILIPLPDTYGIYHDDYAASHGLFQPITTLWAILGWLAVAVACLKKHALRPILAFGFGWFLGGHALESTIIGLELYFEHRNYLPSFGLIFMAVTLAILSMRALAQQQVSAFLRRSLLIGGIAYLAIVSLAMHNEARLWGDPKQFAIHEFQENPQSLRASQNAAAYFANQGDFFNAAKIQNSISKKWPDILGVQLYQLMMKCHDPRVIAADNPTLLESARSAKFDRGTQDAMRQLLELVLEGDRCGAFDLTAYREIMRALLNNPHFGRRSSYITLLSRSHSRVGDYQKAAEVYARYANGDIKIQAMQLQMLAQAGQWDQVRSRAKQILQANQQGLQARLFYLPYIERLYKMSLKSSQ